MFKFRGQTKSGEWVVGGLTRGYVNDELRYVYHVEDDELNLYLDIQPGTLSVSTGKLDSNGVEIFASFEIDGVMTTGGDAVSVNGNNYNIKYSPDLASFIAVNVNGKESGKLFHYIDIDNLTIIGKQGGGNDRRLNIMAQIGMERIDLHT